MPDTMILDTCALLWLVSDSNRLSDSVRRDLDAAQFVYVSPISAWEIGILVKKDRLVLPKSPKDWFEAAVDAHDLVLAHLSVAVLTRANDLPWHHRDPADRFIIASANLLGATVVTADERFRAYDVPVVC